MLAPLTQAHVFLWLLSVKQESFEVDRPDEFCKGIKKLPIGRGGRLVGVLVIMAASINEVTVTVGLQSLA